MSFRENLLHLRAVHGMTQEQLAEQLGVSRQSVTKWEADKSYPEMDKLIKLCQIFGCTLDELVQGDMTDRTAGEEATEEADALEEDLPGEADMALEFAAFDDHMRTFATRISTGVMAIILGVAISIAFYSLGDPESAIRLLPENVSAALGTLCTLVGVVLGLALLVPAGLDHASFVRQHPHMADLYTEQDKAKTRRTFTYELICGIIFIFAGVIVVILFSDGPLEELVGVPVMLLLIAFGVRSIIHGSMVFGMTNVANYNQAAGEVLQTHEIEEADVTPEQKEQLMQAHVADKRIGALCGAIMIVATIAGLVLLFVPSYHSSLFWLAWPIGGLLCGFVSLVVKAFAKEG